MNPSPNLTRIVIIAFAASLATSGADEIRKANNSDPLDAGTSWVGGIAPGSSDLATWDSTISVAANKTNTLGADLSWGGMRIVNPAGGTSPVHINPGNVLTLGSLGIIMTNATRDLVLSNDVVLGSSQEWGGASGQDVWVYGQISGPAGNTLTKAGADIVELWGANTFSGDVVVNEGRLTLANNAALGNSTSLVVNTSITGTGQNAGSEVAFNTSNAEIPGTVTLTMFSSTVGGDYRTTLTCRGNPVTGVWNGPIIVSGDSGIHFGNNNAANTLVIGGGITGSNFTGTVRSRGGGSNAFMGVITIPNGDFVKHEGGSTLINTAGNTWGPTAINNGTIVLGADNALPIGTFITFGNTANSGLLDLAGHTQEIGGLAIAGTGIANKIYSSSTSADSTLIFNGTGATTFDGLIDDNILSIPSFPHVNLTVEGGDLILTSANSYSGTTTVKNGTSLTVSSAQSGSGAYDVADGGALGVNVTFVGGTLPVSSLNLGSATGCSLTLDLGSLGNPITAPISASSLSAQGTVTINVKGLGLLEGQFPLISHGGTIGGGGFGALALGPLPKGVVSAYLSNNVSSVDLVITLAAGSKIWTAANNSNWDIDTTTNWINTVTFQPDTYKENPSVGDLVLFDDTSLSQTVNLAASVKPLLVALSNYTAYTIGGAGTIYGSGSMIKGGGGTVTLTTANSFSGGVTHYEGTIQVGNNAALGSGRLTVEGASAILASDSATPRTLANPVTFSSDVTFGDLVSSGSLTLQGPTDLNNGSRNLTLNIDSIWTGDSTNGRLNKSGPGTLTMKGMVDYNGTTEIRDGTVILDGATVTNTAAFRPDTDQPFGLARLVLTNGAVLTLTADNANARAGIDGNTLGTNILDIAGAIRCPNATAPDGRLFIAAGSALGVANLWPGGDVEARSVQHGGTNVSQLYFNGGILRPIADNPAFMEGLTEVYVGNGGAIIDTAEWNITIAQDLLSGGSGGLTKNGLGTLTLLGANSYTGNTVVTAGTLVMTPAHAGGGAITVNDGATLGVQVGVGGPTLVASSLTLGSASSSWIEFDFGSGPLPITAPVSAGVLTPNGSAKIIIRGSAFAPGTIPLIQYSGAIGGGGYPAFSLDPLPRGVVATLVNNTGTSTIELNISAVNKLTWAGSVNGDWDINSTLNWTLGGTPAVFIDGDAALFDETATGTTTVNLLTNVAPRSVVVDNTLKPYTLQGTGGIVGNASLTKAGTGLLTLATPNTYSGDTVISAGTLALGANDTLPDGLAAGNVTVDGTLNLNGFGDALNGLSGSGVVDNSAAGSASLSVGGNDASSTFAGTIKNTGGALSLSKTGAGRVQLAGVNSYSGGTVIPAGTLQAGNGLALGTGPVNLAGGTLALANAMTLTNALQFSVNNSHITNDANSGTVVFSGGVDFLGGNRYIYIDSDVVVSGESAGGGIERKFGMGTLTFLNATGDQQGNLEIREGDVVFDSSPILKSVNGIRLMCSVPNGVSHLIVTNGSVIDLSGTGQNVRVGSGSPAGDATATNIANISGTIQFNPATAAGAIQIGSSASLCQLNLLAGGVLKIRTVAPQQSTGISQWNFNGGVLQPIQDNPLFMINLSEANVLAGGAIIDTAGQNITIGQALLDGGGGGGLTKLGAGTLLLDGLNTYTGSTVVSNGVLGGSGLITGPVIVQTGGTLSPGGTPGTLTLGSTLTLNAGSTTFVEVDAALGTSDSITGITTANYGGTLFVTNVSFSPISAGQSFTLFSAGNATGNFSSIEPSPGGGLSWSFNPANGVLSAVSGLPSTPTNISYSVTGGSLTLSWPANYTGWILQAQTNALNVGLVVNPASWFDVAGSSSANSVTVPLAPGNPTVFYRLRRP